MIEHIPNYKTVMINIILLITPLMDELDIWVRIVSGVVGSLLAIYTIIKFHHQIKNHKIERKIKEVELQKQDQELAALILRNNNNKK